ncbi:MAG: stage II sporulation protein P [Clostridium sp.]|uniref:stage II sporulation protein P n=1 Tax=Clostridium sp. TaxID=1506 RepID=UPI003F31A5BC
MKEKNIIRSKNGTMDVGIVILLVCIVIFFARCIYILSNNDERGGLAYVQLLNFTMPIVETQVYNEDEYYENNFSIKNICLEAVGLKDISPLKLIKSELPIFKDSINEYEDGGFVEYKPFELTDGSVSKYTDSEKKNLYNPELKKELNSSKPEVLIYHTHTSEGYAESSNFTDDANLNVVGVGNIIEKELEEKYGISVIHDKTKHDLSYNGSYNRSRETVKRYQSKYGDSFKLVIDLHRDGLDRKKATPANKNAFTAKVNGENLAKISYVNAKNSSKFAVNSKVEKELAKITNELYPGFARPTTTYNSGINAFNQDIFSNSVLIEVGANINKSEESMNSAKYIARVIAEYINGK